MRINSKWVILFGSIIIACGLGLLIFIKISEDNVQNQTAGILTVIEEVLPSNSDGSVGDYSSNVMPVMEIKGEDIIGVIKFKTLGVSLPIGDEWDNEDNMSYPKRLSGSVYNNSLVIGGYDSKGQFDCLKKLDIGNRITITDMTGAQFKFEVKDIKRKKSIEENSFRSENTHLTLFVRDSNSSVYIIVQCINLGSN